MRVNDWWTSANTNALFQLIAFNCFASSCFNSKFIRLLYIVECNLMTTITGVCWSTQSIGVVMCMDHIAIFERNFRTLSCRLLYNNFINCDGMYAFAEYLVFRFAAVFKVYFSIEPWTLGWIKWICHNHSQFCIVERAERTIIKFCEENLIDSLNVEKPIYEYFK